MSYPKRCVELLKQPIFLFEKIKSCSMMPNKTYVFFWGLRKGEGISKIGLWERGIFQMVYFRRPF